MTPEGITSAILTVFVLLFFGSVISWGWWGIDHWVLPGKVLWTALWPLGCFWVLTQVWEKP